MQKSCCIHKSSLCVSRAVDAKIDIAAPKIAFCSRYVRAPDEPHLQPLTPIKPPPFHMP
ncbi:hypothetical protein CHARACLAT_011968, partial [Characodon lateralis]|nr:hypothetical protein [Characodon lateralis]